MDILNQSGFEHALAIGMGPDRAAHIGVVVKATYLIPEQLDAPVELAEEQVTVATSDEYFNGDVTGSVRTDAENMVFKPRADVFLVGRAHAPRGRPVTELDAAVRVGARTTMVRVIGDRQWVFPTALAVVPSMTAPAPFVTMPLVYERSFGGFDHKGADWCPMNPIGRGFIATKSKATVDGRMLPNIEDPRNLIGSWDDRPDPVGFGVFAKAWMPRSAHTGVRVDDLHPDFGLASDFDHAFYNAAHPALQVVGFLTGDEEVELLNVTPDAHRRFRLPGVLPSIRLRLRAGAAVDDDDFEAPPAIEHPFHPVLDTLGLFPDDGVFTLTWRASRPITGDLEQALDRIHSIAIDLEVSKKVRRPI